jgi:hypothetical protein
MKEIDEFYLVIIRDFLAESGPEFAAHCGAYNADPEAVF